MADNPVNWLGSAVAEIVPNSQPSNHKYRLTAQWLPIFSGASRNTLADKAGPFRCDMRATWAVLCGRLNQVFLEPASSNRSL